MIKDRIRVGCRLLWKTPCGRGGDALRGWEAPATLVNECLHLFISISIKVYSLKSWSDKHVILPSNLLSKKPISIYMFTMAKYALCGPPSARSASLAWLGFGANTIVIPCFWPSTIHMMRTISWTKWLIFLLIEFDKFCLKYIWMKVDKTCKRREKRN